MTQEEIKEYISANLKVEIVPFGGNEFQIKLLLEGEKISEDYYTAND